MTTRLEAWGLTGISALFVLTGALLLAVLDWEALNTSPGRSRDVTALAGGVGAVFFGGRSGVLVARAVLARRR